MRFRVLALFMAAVFLSVGSASAAIIHYDYNGTFTSGALAGQTVTGFVEIDSSVAVANTYLSADTPATIGISGAILDWEFRVGNAQILFDDPSTTTGFHNAYYLSSIVTPPATMTEWYVDLSRNSNPSDTLRLGTNAFGGTGLSTTISSMGSTGTGTFTLGVPNATVPEPASLAIWGGLGIAGLVAARRRKKVTA